MGGGWGGVCRDPQIVLHNIWTAPYFDLPNLMPIVHAIWISWAPPLFPWTPLIPPQPCFFSFPTKLSAQSHPHGFSGKAQLQYWTNHILTIRLAMQSCSMKENMCCSIIFAYDRSIDKQSNKWNSCTQPEVSSQVFIKLVGDGCV